MSTARNARGIDVIAYNYDASDFIGIQVKTVSKRDTIPLDKSLEKIMGDFWVIVNKAATEKPDTFILLPNEVRQLAYRGEKEGRVSYWLQPNDYDKGEFREKWDRIGFG
jgi:hypothetical protein